MSEISKSQPIVCMELSSSPFLEFMTLIGHLYTKTIATDSSISFAKWKESQLVCTTTCKVFFFFFPTFFDFSRG